MDVQEIHRRLVASRATLRAVSVPEKPGVYAIFLRQGAEFPIEMTTSDRIIYVGSSINFAVREYTNHFSSTSTGFSTLRRSIGALLKDKLSLTAIPRGSGSAESNYTNYRFECAGENRLTKWMETNLEVGVCPVDGDFVLVEQMLVTALEPVLCLKGWENPHAKYIKSSRKTCADEARKAR